MARTIVGVLRGGTSSEYNLSLKTGAAMIAALPEEHYEVRDILVDRKGYWHQRGIPVTAARALSQVDVVLNGLLGGVGEDGTVQRLLERAGVPYTGSRAHPAALSLSKIRSRNILQSAGVRMPRGVAFSLQNDLNTGEMAESVFLQFGPPYIVKPPSEGASWGIRIVKSFPKLPDVIADMLDAFGVALVEEFVIGEHVSVGLVEDFRDQELYALPPAHVQLPEDAPFIIHSHHEDGSLRHAVPSNFTRSEKKAIEELAKRAHRVLQLAQFSRADIVLTKYGPFLIEVNSLPGLYPGSSFVPMLESVGSSTREFLEHSIAHAHR